MQKETKLNIADPIQTLSKYSGMTILAIEERETVWEFDEGEKRKKSEKSTSTFYVENDSLKKFLEAMARIVESAKF